MSTETMLGGYAIVQRLPDLPRWVEARDLLRGETCELFGLQDEPELALALRDPDTGAVFVIGSPAVSAVQAAVQKTGRGVEVIAPPEQVPGLAEALPGWRHQRILLHLLSDPERLPTVPPATVGFLDPATLRQFPIPPDLLEELESAAEHSAIAATFVGEQPVSFCYAGAVTETLWDISIDTLPQHRRRGYAALCVTYMIQHMHAQGKAPVWAALEENPASWRLAQKLGFTPVDELALFEPEEQASLGETPHLT